MLFRQSAVGREEQKSSSLSNVNHYLGAEGETPLGSVKLDLREGGSED